MRKYEHPFGCTDTHIRSMAHGIDIGSEISFPETGQIFSAIVLDFWSMRAVKHGKLPFWKHPTAMLLGVGNESSLQKLGPSIKRMCS